MNHLFTPVQIAWHCIALRRIATYRILSHLIASYRIMNFRNSLRLYQLWYFSLDLNKIVNIAAINHSTVILRWTWWSQQHEKSPKNLPKKDFRKEGENFSRKYAPSLDYKPVSRIFQFINYRSVISNKYVDFFIKLTLELFIDNIFTTFKMVNHLF